MSESRIRVGVLFGGKSAEHEISLLSAKNVIDALDRDKFEPVLIGIDKSGRWLLNRDSQLLLNSADPKTIKLNPSSECVALLPESAGELTAVGAAALEHKVDVVFPILHGPMGEDGTIQGLLKLANVPFVGAGVLGSAVGMDKVVMKRLLREAGLPIPDFIACRRTTVPSFEDVKTRLGLPVFVKPANLGSSVGISKVEDADGYARAIQLALRFDNKLIIEENVAGREIECAVLGNDKPQASVPGEVIPQRDFYSYEAKYLDDTGALLEMPAKLDADTVARVQDMAVKAFQALECEGMARVDTFLCADGKLLVNEINTIPGFTRISMYPKLWELSGVPYRELISRLIALAMERHALEQKLVTSFDAPE